MKSLNQGVGFLDLGFAQYDAGLRILPLIDTYMHWNNVILV